MNGRTSKLLRRLAVASLSMKPGFNPKGLDDVKAATKAETSEFKRRFNATPRNERHVTRRALVRTLINIHEGVKQ
jgi:hypothetical protein